MGKAGRRHRLKAPIRRDPAPLRFLRLLAALSVVGLAGLVGYELLTGAGFEFRFSVDRALGPPTTARVDPPAAEADAGAAPPPVSGVVRDAERADASPSVADEGLLERPGPRASPSARGRSEIDFEAFADGRPVCTGCPVSDEWRDQGLVLSFRSWTADSRQPYVLDARNYLPEDASMHAIGPALSVRSGLEVGVTRLDFPYGPRRVSFRVYGPDLIESFSIVAWSRGERLDAAAQSRFFERRYSPAGRSAFRAERVVIESADGIDRVSLDGWGPPGHMLLIDDVVIEP